MRGPIPTISVALTLLAASAAGCATETRRADPAPGRSDADVPTYHGVDRSAPDGALVERPRSEPKGDRGGLAGAASAESGVGAGAADATGGYRRAAPTSGKADLQFRFDGYDYDPKTCSFVPRFEFQGAKREDDERLPEGFSWRNRLPTDVPDPEPPKPKPVRAEKAVIIDAGAAPPR